MTYQCQYLTIRSSPSECDHKCETQNAEPEIRPDGSSQTRRNLSVDGYGSGFGPPRVSGSAYWPGLEPNRPRFAVQTRTAGRSPGHVANSSRTSNLSHTEEIGSIPHPGYINSCSLICPSRMLFMRWWTLLDIVPISQPGLSSSLSLLALSVDHSHLLHPPHRRNLEYHSDCLGEQPSGCETSIRALRSSMPSFHPSP